MKKILMGTSALALAGTIAGAGKAEAATWDLDWGGFYEAAVAYRDSDAFDNSQDGVDVITDQEIIFTPSIVLDNGLKFGVNVQLEGDSDNDGDQIDESYAFVEGSFGIVRLGSTDSAHAAMLGNAPDVSWIGASSGSLAGLIGIPEFVGTYAQPGGGDATKIVYFTPRFSGFQVGVSYAHDGSEDKRSPGRSAAEIIADPNGLGGRDFNDLMSIGANYVNSFGAFDIEARAGYSRASSVTGNVDPTSYAVNLNVGYAGFTVGGSYANTDTDVGNIEVDFFDLGVSYETGPWGVSLQYSNGDLDGANSDTDQYLGAVSYKLGPGVTAGAFAGYAENTTGTVDQDGFIIGTGFKLSF